MEYPGFIGGSYEGLSRIADQEHTVNLYVTMLDSEGASAKKALYPTPGVDAFTTLVSGGGGVGRAHAYFSGREFAVLGDKFIELTSEAGTTVRGTVAVDGFPATISSNGENGGQLFVTSGGSGYTFTLSSNAFAIVASEPWTYVSMGAFSDGYFLALDSSESRMYVSDLNDGTTWGASQFAERSLASDNWVAMRVNSRYVWLLGSATTEVWYNVGSASSFPFAPYAIGLIQLGCAAPWSVAVVNDKVVWLAQTDKGGLHVAAADGFSPERVSTGPLDEAISAYQITSDAIGDWYADQGHTFYLLTFDAQDITWCYDLDTGVWHQRATWSTADGEYKQWRPRWVAYAFGEHRVLDSLASNVVYELDTSYTDEPDGSTIRRLRRAPALEFENKRLFYSSFELLMDVGLGNVTGDGSDPQVMMRFSNDGGNTWSSEAWRSAGKQGEYSIRVRWNRLGSGRKRVIEVAWSEPVPWRVVAAYVTLGADGLEGAR